MISASNSLIGLEIEAKRISSHESCYCSLGLSN